MTMFSKRERVLLFNSLCVGLDVLVHWHLVHRHIGLLSEYLQCIALLAFT